MHDVAHNPFTPDFGREPPELIPRTKQAMELIASFNAESSSQHIRMVTGIRGCGKTVFMTNVGRQLAMDPSWTVVELNPEQDLLESILAQLQISYIDLSDMCSGLKLEGAQANCPEIALEKILQDMKKRGKKLLIVLDEVTKNQYTTQLARTFHSLVRLDLPLYLIMTEPHDHLSAWKSDESLTFLFRAPRIALEPLNIGMMADSYERIFHIEKNQAIRMARDTRGYACAFQVLGYFTWLYPDHPIEVSAHYKDYLYEFVYDKVWAELSVKDRRILTAMNRTPGGKIKDIRARLNMDTNQFNPYRMRLIRKGIVDGNNYGELHFCLPLFEEYIEVFGTPEDMD